MGLALDSSHHYSWSPSRGVLRDVSMSEVSHPAALKPEQDLARIWTVGHIAHICRNLYSKTNVQHDKDTTQRDYLNKIAVRVLGTWSPSSSAPTTIGMRRTICFRCIIWFKWTPSNLTRQLNISLGLVHMVRDHHGVFLPLKDRYPC